MQYCSMGWKCVTVSTQVGHYITLREQPERRVGKNVRAEGWGGVLWNSVWWMCYVCSTNELITSMISYTKSAKDKAS